MPQDVENPRIANAITAPDEQEEIEITPEMIEAGREELRGFNRDFDDERDIVALIYAAMHRAASSARR
jgi:hypothetical protein